MRKPVFFLILLLFCLNILPDVAAQNCLTSRLSPNGQAIVTPGSSNRIRSQASTSAEQVGQIPAGGVFDLLEGPRCVEGFLWWRINYNGITGWTVEASRSDYFVDPVTANATQAPVTSDGGTCSLTPRLRINGFGRTSSNTPSRLRSAAGSSNQQIGQINPVDTFVILAGPVCVEGLNWWQVRVGGNTGWIAEGSGSDYFVELLPNTATPTATRTALPTNTPTVTRTPTITLTPSTTPSPTITPTQTPTGFAEAHAIAWNADGSRLAVASSEGVFIYYADNWNESPQKLLDTPSDSLAFSPTEPDILVVNSSDDSFSWRVYDISTAEILASEAMSESPVGNIPPAHDFVFSADGETLAYSDRDFQVINTDNWRRRTALAVIIDAAECCHMDFLRIQPAAYSPDARWGFGVTNRKDAYLFDVSRPQTATSQNDPRISPLDRSVREQWITAAAFSPDSQFVIAGDETGSLQMWNIASRERISFIRDTTGISQSNRINAIAFHPNGIELATAESDPQGIVRIFQADELSQLETYGLNAGYRAAVDVSYSPDGALLAVIMDNYIHLLETENYTLIRILVQMP